VRTLNCKSGPCFKLFLLGLSILLANNCAAAETQFEKAPDERAYYCNEFLPERIILNLTENPLKSQAVTWRTLTKVKDPKAQIVPVTDNLSLDENLTIINAATETVGKGKDKTVCYYSAVFKNLKPNTMYAYRVGTDGYWSEWNQFKTASKSHDPFKFAYLGDPQNDIKSMCSQIFRAAYKKAPDASFWLFVGDLVNNGDNDEQWAELFYALGWIPRTTSMMLLPGNHGYTDKRYVRAEDFKLHHLWRPHFTLPENGPHGLEETAYFFDYQGVRFVMLNGNEKIEEQAQWLDRILSENPQPWTIAGIHQPVYSTVRFRDDSKRQSLLVPIFDKHSVDLVLQGHDHTYCRSYKIKNGVRVKDNEKGTVYVVSVSGPKYYKLDTPHQELMAKMETDRQLFQVIHIDHDRLHYEAFDVTGDLYDSFVLEKTNSERE
jgi:hypothetical protein